MLMFNPLIAFLWGTMQTRFLHGGFGAPQRSSIPSPFEPFCLLAPSSVICLSHILFWQNDAPLCLPAVHCFVPCPALTLSRSAGSTGSTPSRTPRRPSAINEFDEPRWHAVTPRPPGSRWASPSWTRRRCRTSAGGFGEPLYPIQTLKPKLLVVVCAVSNTAAGQPLGLTILDEKALPHERWWIW